MTKCTSCGVEHGVVIEDIMTGETKPVDWCENCIFKGYVYRPINGEIEFDAFQDWGKQLRRKEDEIIRDMSR